MNANNNTTTAAAIDNLAAKVAANATAAIEQTTTPSKTGVVRWAKRAGALVAVVGVGYAAHRFGLTDFLKAKFGSGSCLATTDAAV